MKRNIMRWGGVIILVMLLVVFILFFKQVDAMLGGTSQNNIKYDLPKLIAQHLKIVGISSLFAVVIGMGLGLFCISEKGRELRGLMEKFAYLGQMIPSIALLTILVPILGTGLEPAVIALVILGILPIYSAVVTGIGNIPAEMIEVARGMGMNELEILTRVSLPLAFPVIIAGLRIALVINISVATLAAFIGAGGLGIPIFDAMRTMQISSIIEGTIPVILMAFIVDRLLKNIEDMLSTKYQLMNVKEDLIHAV